MSVIINIHSKYYYHFYIAFLHAISNYFYNARFFYSLDFLFTAFTIPTKVLMIK